MIHEITYQPSLPWSKGLLASDGLAALLGPGFWLDPPDEPKLGELEGVGTCWPAALPAADVEAPDGVIGRGELSGVNPVAGGVRVSPSQNA